MRLPTHEPLLRRRRVNCRTLAPLFLLVVMVVAGRAQDDLSWPTTGMPVQRVRRSSPALQQSLRAAISSGRLDELRWPEFPDVRASVEKLYSQSKYAPTWLLDGQQTPQALQMIDILQQADNDGLRAQDYDAGRWTDRLARLQQQHATADEARFDVALTVCAMRYASALHVGRIDARYFKYALEAGPEELDLPAFVQQRLADGTDLKAELQAVEPPFAGYRELKKTLLAYMRLVKEDDGEKLPVPADIGYPGPPYPGFIRLTRLLRLLGDLPASYSVAAASSQPYDPALLQAVRRFQGRHNLPETGYLDAATVEQLNVPLSARVDQIRLALERFRWVGYKFPQPPILVNIAGFYLHAFDQRGKMALSMRVDVGDAFTRTPVMEDSIEYLVFRPYWDVPVGIQKEEIAPAIAEDPAYLSKYHFEVIEPNGAIVTSGKVSSKVLSDLRAGRLRVRQRPGPDNALGLVKFIFPNRYSVYLHDIPAREFAFTLPQRVVSHGCVHVEKPDDLAAWVLRDKPEWSLERVRQAMHNGQNNQRVTLSKPVPVLMLYITVSVRDGEAHFYRDIYGYDADLLTALAKGYPFPK